MLASTHSRGTRPQRIAEVALQHAHHRLRLCALGELPALLRAGQFPLHPAAIMSGGRFARRRDAAHACADQRAHAQFQPGQAMIGFGVVAGVGQHRCHRCSLRCVAEQPAEARRVGAHAGSDTRREDHVRARVHAGRELGRGAGGATSLRIRRATLRLGVVPAATFVVAAAVMRVIAGGVDRQRGAECLCHGEPFGQQVQHPRDTPAAENHSRSPVECGVVGRLAHADGAAPGPAVAQQRFGPAVAEPHLLAHHQAGEQLREREVTATELGGILAQALRAQGMSGAHHLPWRFARQHPASSTRSQRIARLVKSGDSEGRDRALPTPFLRGFAGERESTKRGRESFLTCR
jgi:hypothetical protein